MFKSAEGSVCLTVENTLRQRENWRFSVKFFGKSAHSMNYNFKPTNSHCQLQRIPRDAWERRCYEWTLCEKHCLRYDSMVAQAATLFDFAHFFTFLTCLRCIFRATDFADSVLCYDSRVLRKYRSP